MPSRDIALVWMWVSLLLGLLFLVVFPIAGLAILLAPLWYWLSIRWMDRHNAW